MKITIKKHKPNFARIHVEYDESFNTLRDSMSVMKRNFAKAKWAKDKKYLQKSCITRSGVFEIGLLFDIILQCRKLFGNNTLSLELDDEIKNYTKVSNLELDCNVFVNENNDDVRQFQKDSMKIALNRTNGTYILGTGAGKTLCTALLIHNLFKHELSKQIMLVVPFPHLASETIKELSKSLKDYNYTFSKWFDKFELNESADVIVVGAAKLRSQYDKVKTRLKDVDCLIIDEMHQLKLDALISKIINGITTERRYGFTGTLPYDKLEAWSVKGKCGPECFNLSSFELRNDNFLTNAQVINLEIPFENPPILSYQEEVTWLINHKKYNETIAMVVDKLKNNTLILYNRTDHGQLIFEECSKLKNKNIKIIKGDIPINEREEIIKLMEKQDDIILIAQVMTFSTGINVKNLHNIVFSGCIGKSNITIVQTIGRGLRLHENKKMLNIIDIVPGVKYAMRHNQERQKIYNNEKIPIIKKTNKNML